MSAEHGITNKTIVALTELEMMVASNPGTAKKERKKWWEFSFYQRTGLQNINCEKAVRCTLHKHGCSLWFCFMFSNHASRYLKIKSIKFIKMFIFIFHNFRILGIYKREHKRTDKVGNHYSQNQSIYSNGHLYLRYQTFRITTFFPTMISHPSITSTTILCSKMAVNSYIHVVNLYTIKTVGVGYSEIWIMTSNNKQKLLPVS